MAFALHCNIISGIVALYLFTRGKLFQWKNELDNFNQVKLNNWFIILCQMQEFITVRSLFGESM